MLPNKRRCYISFIICILSINLISGINNIDKLEGKLKTVSGRERVDVLNKLARKHWDSSFEKAIEYGQEALQLSQKLDYVKGEAESCLSIGRGYNTSNNYDKAFKYLRKSLEIFKEIGDKKGVADSLNIIGNNYWCLGNYKKALECDLEILNIRKEVGDKRGIAVSLNNIGLFYKNSGDYDKALEYYLKSIKTKKEIGDKKGIAATLNNIGISYLELGNYDKALDYNLKSLKMREESGNKKGISDSLRTIGIIYTSLSNYDKAMEYYHRSLKIEEELGDKRGIADALNSLGNTYDDLNDYDKALEHYIKSLQIMKDTRYKKGISSSLNNIGVTHIKLKNYEKALDYLTKSVKTYEEVGNKRGIAVSLANIGQVHQNLKSYDRAHYYLERSLKIAKEIGAKECIQKSYEHFSDLYIAKSDYKKALEYYKLSVDVKDDIFSKESSDKIAEMQVKFETEKKEKEIELLQKDKEIQNLEISRQRNYLYGLVAISCLVLALFLAAYSRYRARRKANRILSEKNCVITEQRDQLTRTLDELRETQKILVDTSHRAGMSEMANGTLHNIGNALNSVKVSAQVLKEKSEESETNNLRQIIRLIENNADDPITFMTMDEKGKMIPSYLAKAGNALEKERAAFMEELSNLNNGINHIVEILAVQQDYAGVSGIAESATLSNMLDDILRMYHDIFRRHNIKLVKRYKETTPVSVEKIKLMQVFANLLKNAKESMEQKSDGARIITIDALEDEDKNCQMVKITDNGAGISKENLDRIFQFGFTTKEGRNGFGLHISALDMTELNGGLSVFSEGDGLGATFTVVVPKQKSIGCR